ncbi:MAG: PilZ domain-containing protein [Candidatus Omnitrophica bacterium]|nr:PilZ domain-containing protein [Candidatus Omnitrophota bacterium]MBU1923770.1 PilZ domain-containing protein [Candidatus Omnitrophota bacterium]
MEEKRKSVRIEKSLMVRYSPETNNKDSWNFSFIKNVSETGILFDTNKQFQIGENIRIMLKVPLDPDNWMEINGCVVESIPYIGKYFLTRLEFICINETQKNLIKDYVSECLSNINLNSPRSWQNEKRKAERISKNLIVSYGVQNHLGVVEKWDITTVSNFSKTGMVFTSSCICEGEIDFMIKVPSHPYESLRIRGRVIESSALKLANSKTASGTFVTRVEFIVLEKEQNKLFCDYVDWLLKNNPNKSKKEDE